ncbi:MAG: zinc ribbon domain-containing protein [Proteobacteria bacterium]|nr:zinc ribbon domain-containing protein [Pseudomonadota bacterium]
MTAPIATAPAAGTHCRGCREALVADGHFCTRCGLPTADACPRCGADVPLGAGACGGCDGPLVHCENCGRVYPVERTRCENVDWTCAGAPLVSAFGAFSGLHGSLGRTGSVGGGPVALRPLSAPLFMLEDRDEAILDMLVAYGRAFLISSREVASVPLRLRGAIDPLDPAIARSVPLAARGREFRGVIDAAVGFGMVTVIFERHDRASETFVFRADDVSASWRLTGCEGARAAVPTPHGVLVFMPGEVKRFAPGSVDADGSAAIAAPPRVDAPPAVHLDGMFVVYGAADGAVVRVRVEGLETHVLRGPGSAGPPVLGPRYVHVLSRDDSNLASTTLHQIEVDTGAHDAVALPIASDLCLRGAGPSRLVFDTQQRAYREVALTPWPARLQAGGMPRPENEDRLTELLLDGAGHDVLLLALEGGRTALRVVRFDGEAVLRGALASNARFVACDDLVLLTSEGRLKCYALA